MVFTDMTRHKGLLETAITLVDNKTKELKNDEL